MPHSKTIDLERLSQHLDIIAQQPHPAESEALEEVRRYICDQFQQFGWQVEEVPFHAYFSNETTNDDEVIVIKEADFDPKFRKKSLRGVNLVAKHSNEPNPNTPKLCVGAHYDTKPTTPGADDNTSAVATLLELARLLPTMWNENQTCSIELVAFDLEENGMLGGQMHAQCYQEDQEKKGQQKLLGMVSLEMLGYCSHDDHSQTLPQEIAHLYPHQGNFIAVVGNQNSSFLIEKFVTGLKTVANLPVEALQVTENGRQLPATRLSDHSPFWDAGFPAVMVTDTSFLRNPHYHQPSDTVETLDKTFLHKVAQGCLNTVSQIISG